MIKDETHSYSVSAGSKQTLFSYQFPARAKGRLLKFGNDVDNKSAYGSIIWRILKNGVAIYPYDNIKDCLGLITNPIDIIPISFSGGDTITVIGENNYSSTVVIACRVVFEVE